jgi:hypothetical protein
LLAGSAGSGKTSIALLFLLHSLLTAGPNAAACFVSASRAQALDAARRFRALWRLAGGGFCFPDPGVIVASPETAAALSPLKDLKFGALFAAAADLREAFGDEGVLSRVRAAAFDEAPLADPDGRAGAAAEAALGRAVLEAWRRRAGGLAPLRVLAAGGPGLAVDKALAGILSHKNSPWGRELAPPVVVAERAAGAEPVDLRFQPSSAKARFRAFGLRELAGPDLCPEKITLDAARGSNFKNIAVGWLPRREKVIYASPAAPVLYGFAKFVTELGRSEAGSVANCPSYLSALEGALAREGAAPADAEYYLGMCRRGVFFHYELLGALSRALMLEGFREFQPEGLEPFVLCSTGSLAWGVPVPARALFLDAVFWPKTGRGGAVSMELMDPRLAAGLLGRLACGQGGGGGPRPLALVNWPMWRGFEKSGRFQFAARKNKLLSLFAGGSAPEERGGPAAAAREGPPALADELILGGLWHASAMRGGGAVGAAGVLRFLGNTPSARGWIARDPSKNPSRLANLIDSRLRLAAESLPGLVLGGGANGAGAGESGGGSAAAAGKSGGGSGAAAGESGAGAGAAGSGGKGPRGLRPGPLLAELLARRAEPASVAALLALCGGFPADSEWRGPELSGLAAALLAPVAACLRECLPRAFQPPPGAGGGGPRPRNAQRPAAVVFPGKVPGLHQPP